MNDFADWFSPIIVKELRQGMRAKAFIGIFLSIQVFMIFYVLVSLGSDPTSRASVSGLFWTVISMAILFAMPLRGVAALNGEMKGNTLELMLLTQLSAWRITAGKWLALVLQTLLLVCAVLPYVVLRYFLGGVNLVDDLAVLGWMVVGSTLLMALAVGLSPFLQSVVGRIVLGLGISMSFNVIPAMMFRSTMGGGVGPTASTMLWAAALLGPLLILELLEIGVGKIAPAAENHGTRKRLIALAFVAVAASLGRVLHQPGLLGLALIVVVPIGVGVLMEETVAIPSLYRPFVRRKIFGRLAGRLLYPGWASGLLFFALVAAFFLWSASLKWSDQAVRFGVLAGLEAIFLPLALVRLCFRRAKSILPFYFGLQLILFLVAIILSTNFNHSDPHLVFTGLIPTVGFFLHVWGNSSIGIMGGAAAALAALSVIGLLILSIKEWKLIGAMEREAATLE